MIERYTIQQARARFGELVNRARLAETPSAITRNGTDAAVVVSVGWYESHRDESDPPLCALAPETGR